MAAMDEMLKRRPLRKTQSLDEFAGQSFSISPSTLNEKGKNTSFDAGTPTKYRKTKSIEQKERRSIESVKIKASEDQSDMLFVTALECVDLAPFMKTSRGLFSTDRNSKETQIEGSIHLAFQLSSAVRRSDNICVPGMIQVHNVAGTGRIDEEYVFDIPGGTVALQVSCLMRKYSGKRRHHQEVLVGHCSIPLDRLPESGDVEQWYSFQHPTNESMLKAAVKLRLKLEVSTNHEMVDNSNQDDSSSVTETESEPVHHTHAHQHPPEKQDKGEFLGPTLGGATTSDRTLSTDSIDDEEEWWRRQVVTSGLVDYIAIIRGGANVTGSDGVSRPEACVTERWPIGDTADGAEFPQKAEWFCFPGGWKPVRGRCKTNKTQTSTEKPMPRIETFVVQLGGSRAWGVCLIDHELNSRNEDEWWWPVGTLLITRLPIIEALKLWLSEFYYFLGRQQGQSQLLSSTLAPFLMQLLVTVPRPVDNVLAIRFDPFGPESRRIVVDVAAPHGLPPFGFNLHASISCLGPKAIVELLGHALGERKMLLHSSDMSTLTPLAEALCCLLYPLQWSHAFVPVLPKVMLEMLDAPQPYIVGIHTDWLKEIHGSTLEDVILVDIDRGSVEAFEDSVMGELYKIQEAREAEDRGWGYNSSTPQTPQPHALPAAVETNLRLLISDYLIHGDLPLDDANAPLFVPSSSESEFRVADMLSHGAAATPLQLSVRSDAAASVQLRLAFAAQFAVLLAGFEQCIYWVDAGYPVFDEKRFLDDFNSRKETEAITQLLNTQMFQQLLENFDDTDLIPFHSLVHHVDIEAKRLKGSGIAGLAAARHRLTEPPLDPAAPSSRVAAIARAARFKAPQPGSGGCCKYTLVVPYMKFDEHKRARSRWSSAAVALQKTKHSFASGGHHRTVGFPSESLILVGVMDDAMISRAELTKYAFESARSKDEELPQETSEVEGGGRFRWKAEPPPLPEDGTVWTVGSVADSSGAPVAHLVQPPVPELDFDHDLLVGAEESSTALTIKSKILTRSLSDPGREDDSEVGHRFSDAGHHSSFFVETKEVVKEPMSCRPSKSKPLTQGGDLFDQFEDKSANTSKPRTPNKAQRRGTMIAGNANKFEGHDSDEEERNENLTPDEQQLTRCVAIALSAPDGPNKELLEECVESIARVPALSQRLVKILSRMRKHAARRKAPVQDSQAISANTGTLSGFRLPCAGFETLATLCHAVVKSCGQHKDYDPPYTLLRLTGAYYQKMKDPKDFEDDELEYLSSRLSENPIYSDLGLWEFVLAKDLKIPMERLKDDLTVADKRSVVQRVTLLLYSMRGIGMTPHRAVMLVRSVVSKYSLSQRQWRQLHGVVCTVWKDASLPAFNKLGFVSSGTSIDEDHTMNTSMPSNPLTESITMESTTTPVAPRKLMLEESEEKAWQNGEDSEVGNCTFFLGNGSVSPKKRRSFKDMPMEEVKEERATAGDAVLPMTTSDSVGTMTCLSIWGDKAVFGGTDSKVRCMQLPYSGRLKREENSSGFSIPNLEVLAQHPAPVTCISLLDPFVISGDSSGVVKLSFPFEGKSDSASPAKSFFSPAPKSSARSSVRSLMGHESAITCIGVPRFNGGNDAPTEGIPSPGLSIPLVATGSLDGVVRVWNLSIAKEEKNPSAWAVFEPPKRQGSGFLPFPNKTSTPSAGAVRSLHLDSWGRSFTSGSNDGYVRLLDIEKETCVGEIACHTAAVRAVRFKGNNSNRILSCSNDRTCCLTDPRAHGFSGNGSSKEWSSSATMLQFLGHGAPVTSLDEGNESDPIFFTGSADCRVMVWDARTSKLPMWVWEGHEGTVMSIRSFGHIVVTAGEDGTVCEWDVKTGRLMRKHKCPAPILAAEASGGRFVTSTWAQRMHVFTFENRRPSIVKAPLAYTGVASPHGGRVNPTWNPTSSLSTPNSNNSDPWNSPTIPSLSIPADIHPPPPLGSPHEALPDIHPPPPLGSPHEALEDDKEKGFKRSETSSVSPGETSHTLWDKMGRLSIGQLDSVTEGDDDDEVEQRMKDSSPPRSKKLIHKVHKSIIPRMSLSEDMANEANRESSNINFKPEKARMKPKLMSNTLSSPESDDSSRERVKPLLKSAMKHDDGSEANEEPKQDRRVVMKKVISGEKEKLDLIDSLTTTRRTRSHTPGKSLGLAAAQRGAVVQEPSKRAQRVSADGSVTTRVRTPRRTSVRSPHDDSEGVVRVRKIRSKDSPRDGTTKVRTVRVRSKGSPQKLVSDDTIKAAKVRSSSPDTAPPPVASIVSGEGSARMVRDQSPSPHRPMLKRSPRNRDQPTLNATTVATLESKPEKTRGDSVSSDLAEMATGLEPFLRGAKLSMHLEILTHQSICELEDLEKVTDDALLELGMKKPEVKRLRRYLKRVLSL